jgi:integrase/recombinase XerD
MKALTKEKYLTPDQVKVLAQATEAQAALDEKKGRTTWPRIWLMIDLALCSGLRVAEMASLKVKDLSLNGKEPYLSVIGKGSKPRDVQIPKSLVKHLKQHIRIEGLGPDDPVLRSSHGKAYTTRALQKHFKKACANAGLPDYFSIHSTRHSYGVLLYRAKQNLREVQIQLGHSKPSTTAIYSDVLPEDIAKDVNETFNGLLK